MPPTRTFLSPVNQIYSCCFQHDTCRCLRCGGFLVDERCMDIGEPGDLLVYGDALRTVWRHHR